MEKLQYPKAFTNHRINGVHLTFPNGNSISTIWGFGSHSDNHNHGEFEVRNGGSDNCEIYPECDIQTMKKIKKILPDLDQVAGYVTMDQWLKVIKILSS